MKHLVISDYGSFLGVNNHRLAVKSGDNSRYFPLNRLATVSIAKRGISISSDLVESLGARGIKLFFLDFRGVAHSALIGQAHHGTVAVRIAQIQFSNDRKLDVARQIIIGKLKNQRATINHLNKYHNNDSLRKAATALNERTLEAQKARDLNTLMGFEGAAATEYFQALRKAKMFSPSFERREGRGSREINNSMLNLGYAVLSSYVLNAIINAGLEPYLGILHGQRPGRMALVLDMMEEYRSWVVDRSVIKLRRQSEGSEELDEALKKTLIRSIQKICATKYIYRGKKQRLEHIIQRQVYALCSCFFDQRKYKPYLFKW